MTRKHFKAIAEIISNERINWGDSPNPPNSALDHVVEALSEYFASENPNFDKDKFWDACKFGKEILA